MKPDDDLAGLFLWALSVRTSSSGGGSTAIIRPGFGLGVFISGSRFMAAFQ
jgi:hypothetical protein